LVHFQSSILGERGSNLPSIAEPVDSRTLGPSPGTLRTSAEFSEPQRLPSVSEHDGRILIYIADSNTAWTVGWSTDPEEIKAALRTFKGVDKVHRQFYHLSVKEMARFILTIFDTSEHAAIKKLIAQVVAACKICQKQQRLAPKPVGQSKGLWAQNVNDLVCADTFFFENVAIMHFLDLFAGWSLLWTSDELGPDPTPQLVEDVFYLWLSIFGGAMRVFFSDQGGEFMADSLGELFRAHSVRVLHSPSQSPFTNPVERHNGVAKVYLKKLRSVHPNAPLRHLLQETQAAKNLTTRKFGFSAQFLAFAHPTVDARTLAAGLDDLYVPPDSVSAQVQERLALRASAQSMVTEVATLKQLQVALTKGMQGTVTGPLEPGQKVDFWVIPSNLVKGHWIGPCTIIGPGGSATGSSAKVWVIKRPNGTLTEAHRHRLRVINPLDHIQVPALEDAPAVEAPVEAPPLADAPAGEPPAPEVLPLADAPAQVQAPADSAGGEPPPAEPVRDVDDTLLKQWLLGQANSGGVSNDWTEPSQELREFVTTTYGEQFPPLLRVAYSKYPARLRKLPRDLRPEDCGERLSLVWDEKQQLKHCRWDYIPTVTSAQIGARISTGETGSDASRFLHSWTLLFGSVGNPLVAFGAPPSDSWVETATAWTRLILLPRVAMFTPMGTKNGPPKGSLTKQRITIANLADGTSQRIEDEWTTKNAHRGLPLPWTGSVVFPKKRPPPDSDEDEPQAAPPAADPSPGPGGSPTSEEPTASSGESPLEPIVPHSAGPAETAEPAEPAEAVAPAPGDTPVAPDELSPATAMPECFDIATPPASPGPEGDAPSPEAELPAEEPAREQDNLETMAARAAAIPGRTTRSGLSFDHRGPRFDPSAHLAVGPPEEYSLGSLYHAFFTQPIHTPAPEWLDSSTLLRTEDAAALVSDHRMPIFDVASSSFTVHSDPSPEFPVSAFLANGVSETPPKAPRNKEIPKSVAIKSPAFLRAMESEIDDLLANGASFGVPPSSTWVFSTRWVFTWKPPPDDKAKARLVARGYEEKWLQDEDGESPVTDSPTLQRETFRLICFAAAQFGWTLQTWDIRTAFQQADTRYDPEASANEHIWFKFPHPFPAKYGVQRGMALRVAANHTHYGLASAPRRFYFFLRGVMQEHGFEVGRYDECLFILLDPETGKLRGLCGWHVDDGLLAGDGYFWSCMETVAKRVKFGKRLKPPLVFCGVRISSCPDGSFELDQEEAIAAIPEAPVESKRSDSDPLTPPEVTNLRGCLGSVLYITGNTRPFEAYAVSHLSAFTTEAKVTHLRQINQVIRHLKATKSFRLRYVKIDGPLVCFTFSDSNFKKERDSGSQTGSVTIIGTAPMFDGWILFNLLRWSSRRTRRVVHSTLAAETLAATFSLDMNEGTRGRLLELSIDCDGVLLVDCRSLFDHVYSMTGKVDEVLVPDYFQLRESCLPFRHAHSPDYDGHAIELWWVPTHVQFADNLTKIRTPSSDAFFQALTQNQFQLLEFERPRKAHQNLHCLWTALVSAFDSRA